MRLGLSLICIFYMIRSLESFAEFAFECPFEEELYFKEDFDWRRMIGEWFIYGLYTYRNNSLYLPPKCAYDNYYRFENNTYLRCFKERSQNLIEADTGGTTVIERRTESHYLLFNTSKDGSYRQCMHDMSSIKNEFEGFNQTGGKHKAFSGSISHPLSSTVCYNYRILDSDYENYAVHYVCDDWSESFFDVPDQNLKGILRQRYDAYVRFEVWIATRDEYPSKAIIERAKEVFRKNDFRTDKILLVDHHCRGVTFTNMTHPGENVNSFNGKQNIEDSENEDSAASKQVP